MEEIRASRDNRSIFTELYGKRVLCRVSVGILLVGL